MTVALHTTAVRFSTVATVTRRIRLPKVNRRIHDGWANAAEQRAFDRSRAAATSFRPFV
ncbi:MAG TPA: hypothetical protein VGL26_03885 [Jatrophihabitans sp.]|jgi:hypothetical protein